MNILSGDAVSLVTGLPPAVPDVGQAIRAAVEEAVLPSSTSEALQKGKCQVSD